MPYLVDDEYESERGVVLVEYALLLSIVAVALIPVLTTFSIAVNHYFERQTANVKQAEIATAQAQDAFIAFMDERIAYLICLVQLTPPAFVSNCGAPPDPS